MKTAHRNLIFGFTILIFAAGSFVFIKPLAEVHKSTEAPLVFKEVRQAAPDMPAPVAPLVRESDPGEVAEQNEMVLWTDPRTGGLNAELTDGGKKDKKIDYKYGLKETTGSQDVVRQSTANVGLGYKFDSRNSLDVEASRTIHDNQDAQAWRRSVEDESAANMEYTFSF
ncbi:MAG TPA: hypothetical protein VL688_07630 [Verrucomicrobiae bacterium]|nr:hypothetical protein [Verrucomicrobiae bacterium]